MGKKSIAITAVILITVVGGVAYLLLSNDSQQAKERMIDNSGLNEAAASGPQSIDTSIPGSYIDYEDGVIAGTEGTKLLFFHAQWCPQCRALDADIEQNGVPDGVAIIKVDYDTSQELRQQYGVTLQTTIVRIDDNGKLVEKFVAYDDPSLNAVIKNLL